MKHALALAVFSLAATAAVAQTTPAAKTSTSDPVTTSLRMLLQRSQHNIEGAVDAMPADKYNYKPTPEQNTFAHLVVHIANSNNGLCSKVADVPAPKVDELKETDSKDKLVSAVKASFAFCSEALAKANDSKLGDDVELFGGNHFPRAMAAMGLASGWADHYGAAAMYLRLNGILPPSAQQHH